MQLWIYDYIDYYRLKKFLISTTLKAKYQKFIKITLILIIKDYIAQDFDFNVYSDLIQQQIFISNLKIFFNVLAISRSMIRLFA